MQNKYSSESSIAMTKQNTLIMSRKCSLVFQSMTLKLIRPSEIFVARILNFVDEITSSQVRLLAKKIRKIIK